MQIRALIVDDEQLARDEMKYLLDGMEDVTIIGEASGGEEAVKSVLDMKPDLVFLDIQMPVMDGFQVIQTLIEKDELPLIVFTTAYDQYAIKAFEVNAVDYLLKPIDRKRLSGAIERVKEALPRKDEFLARIRKLAGNIRIGTKFLPRIVVREEDGVKLVEVEKVAMLHREGTGITAYTDEGTYDSNYSEMDGIEVQLDPHLFIRLGAEHLVNVRKISQIVPWSGGNYIMTLEDSEGTEVRLNRSQAQLLKNKVEGIF